MAAQLWFAGLLAAVSATPAVAEPATESFGPSDIAARLRGPEIFNSVHHAMRQWGSSLHHNGMSYYLATVPEGVLLHHGNNSPDSPTDPDWLAYEIEHAENFAHGRRPGGGGGGGPPPPPRSGGVGPESWWPEPQAVIGGPPPDEPEPLEDDEVSYGYLHTYKTTRPLQFLYIDGMGGGKTSMGTLDSQDYLLRGLNWSTSPRQDMKPKGGPRAKGGPMDEKQRAADLCELAKEWELQGVIRMEAGFEIIKCDFSDGLEEVQALRRPDEEQRGPGGGRPGGGMTNVEYMRGVAERYQGIGASRTIIDYSSMVSAFFYPVNLSNPDPKRPDLPRLSSVNSTDLALIKKDLGDIVANRRGHPPPHVDWQGVSDLIVGRYADRIQYMAKDVNSADKMNQMVSFLLTLFIDYSEDEPDKPAAMQRCSDFYLAPVRPVTEADRLVKAAFEVVTHQICNSLFIVRDQLVQSTSALEGAKSTMRDLMDFLQWTRFKRCPPCALSEVCMIPMWPMGTVEEYNSPRCTNGSDARDGESYWGHGPGGGRGKPPPRF